jgi:hypothetical protein
MRQPTVPVLVLMLVVCGASLGAATANILVVVVDRYLFGISLVIAMSVSSLLAVLFFSDKDFSSDKDMAVAPKAEPNRDSESPIDVPGNGDSVPVTNTEKTPGVTGATMPSVRPPDKPFRWERSSSRNEQVTKAVRRVEREAAPVPRSGVPEVVHLPVDSGNSDPTPERTQVVQCPRCGSFRVVYGQGEAGFSFRCDLGHSWEWTPGQQWPTTVVSGRRRKRRTARTSG